MRDKQTGRFSAIDLTGVKSGMITCIAPTGEKDKFGYLIWEMSCDCGNIVKKSAQVIGRSRPIRSCGCGPKGRPRKVDPYLAIYNKHKASARERGLSFSLDEMTHRNLISGNCHYCGCAPTDRPHPYLRYKFSQNGIDRVDSGKGYDAHNCVTCCPTCNVAKSSMSYDDFRKWVVKAFNHMQTVQR